MSETENRREFLRNAAFSGAGIAAGRILAGLSSGNRPSLSYDIMNEVMKCRKITITK